MKYVCVMFPYPSGAGLHIGHYYNYAIMDSYCRVLRMEGEEVFQPFGYDAFGLPAENYARKVGRDPGDVTRENIENFSAQLHFMGTQYDNPFGLVVTSDKSYQKWTQWLFKELFARGLAYKAKGLVNHCGSCETVLANEQVKDGKCDRCGTTVKMKELEQWYFRITAYKDRLLKNLEWIDYPAGTKKAQKAWLENLNDWCVSRQRKWGCPIPVRGETDTLDTFVDSSFYFIRYCDPNNPDQMCAPDKYKQVDLYVGGNEHACMHLIYARFINMFLYDIGVVKEEEPFKKVVHQGMIVNEGAKMSKSVGNVISPDGYDPDELRLYLMFIGHYFDGGSWSDKNIRGIRRFINKFKEWMLIDDYSDTIDVEKFRTECIGFAKAFKFNRVISTMMIFVNENRTKGISKEQRNHIIDTVEMFAPWIRTKVTSDIVFEG